MLQKKANISVCKFAAACQISDESKDEEKETKSDKEEKTTPSLASLNSNYRELSSSENELEEQVRPLHQIFHRFYHTLKSYMM